MGKGIFFALIFFVITITNADDSAKVTSCVDVIKKGKVKAGQYSDEVITKAFSQLLETYPKVLSPEERAKQEALKAALGEKKLFFRFLHQQRPFSARYQVQQNCRYHRMWLQHRVQSRRCPLAKDTHFHQSNST